MKQLLQVEIPIKVRFSDTDAMGVVWHGNYLRFFEDAREAFGIKYGLSYLDVYHRGFFTPIVKSSVEHKSPINYGEEVVAIAKFHPPQRDYLVNLHSHHGQPKPHRPFDANGDAASTARTAQSASGWW